MPDIAYFGIRHHGVGSARHLFNELARFQPTHILLEGAPEADAVLDLASDAKMRPPVALLAYRVDAPKQSVYYPFATYSPEWQTIQFALKNRVQIQFFDLPLSHRFALDAEQNENTEEISEEEENATEKTVICRDPFDYLAEISGLTNGETWWDTMIEQRQNGDDIFTTVNVAITALRTHLPEATRPEDELREAWMRKMVRQTAKLPDAERIAVVCGAWHVPALQAKVAAKDDNALLKNLPKCKVDCTWIPWTNNRLTLASGYGAGIEAPAWYAHLWQHPDDDGVLWLGKAAQLLREKNFDISAAYVIETVRLAQAAAALRGQSQVRLPDYLDALKTVMGMGDDAIVDLIASAWLIGDDLGQVPDEVPLLPLIADVEQQRKKLRLTHSSDIKTVEWDLRKPLDLQKSVFVHRLRLLGIDWATPAHKSSTGTFKEAWYLQYQPEHHITLTEQAVYGNTLSTAVCAYLTEHIQKSRRLAELTALLESVMPADLPDLVSNLSHAIENLSANNQDALDLLESLPNLVNVVRYGTVHGFDQTALRHLVYTLLARLAAGGVQSCLNIDDDTAQNMFRHIRQADYAIAMLDDDTARQHWLQFIRSQTHAHHIHALLSGNAVKILWDNHLLSSNEAAEIFQQNVSLANQSHEAAYWLQGFLHQAGTVLLIQEPFWRMLDNWLRDLETEHFLTILPLLRRTFADFDAAERRRLGEKAKHQHQPTTTSPVAAFFDVENAQQALATVLSLFSPQSN